MFNRSNSKKLMSLLLVVVLTLAMQVPAFADWISFQNDQTNNGVITGTAPTTSNPSVDPVSLNNTGSWTGVNAESVIKNGKAYTVYNAGSAGARLAITDLSNASAVDVLLDSKANNVSQLSAPYIKTINGEDIVFAGTSYETEVLNISSFTGWTPSGSVTIDTNGKATFNGTGNISGSLNIAKTSNTLNVQTGLNLDTASNATYKIELYDGTNTYELVPAGTAIAAGGYGTYYTYNGETIPAGSYTATISVIPTGGTVSGSTFYLGGYGWQLNIVTDLNGTPTSSIAQFTKSNGLSSLNPKDVSGEGQINTPISYDDEYIYFGIWGGTHSYYQYKYNEANPGNGTLNHFKPAVSTSQSGFDDFYNAGAYSDGINVYFGSDSAFIYKQPVNNFWSSSGTKRDLGSTQANAGQMRSTIAFDGDALYFTSKGTGATGYLWQMDPITFTATAPIQLAGNSTSTPVISANGYVYTGWYKYDPNIFQTVGGVQAVKTNNFVGDPINIYGDGSTGGDPVQASPIVYSDTTPEEEIDYIYFTTNSGNGAGYGYMYDIEGEDIGEIWSEEGTSGNNYAPQGFAADNGYLVYGDNGSYLYIIK